MNRIIINLSRLFAIIISIFGLLVSCQEEIEIPEESMVIAQHFKQVTFEAVSGDGTGSTRTIRNEDGSLSWLPNDEINVFCGQDFSGRFISNNTEIADRTTFTGHFNADIPETSTLDYWAVYPYQSTNSSDGNSVTLTVPSIQVSSPGTFGAGMYPSVAKSNNTSLAFYNVCGSIKFTLSRSDIDMITLVSNGGEPLAGSVRVTFGTDGKPVAQALEGVSEVTLRPSSGNCFEQGKFYYMTVLPVTMSRGFTMTFHTIDGEEGTLESSNAVTIRRSASSKRDNLDTYVTNWHDVESSQDFSETGVYLGILAFNQALYTCPVGLLTSESLSTYKSFIDGLQMKNGTILYYAVDNGLSNMQQGESPKSLSNASLVTFTDGLDQGSLMMNPDYETEDKYLSAVSSRIHSGNVFGMPLSAFSIGIRGSDVQNTDKFRNNLVSLSSSEENAYEISELSELNARFEDVAKNVVLIDYCYDLSLTIPGLPDGAKVRFTFDNVYNASDSNQYIEGTFNLRSRTLSNVTYVGLTSRSGSSLSGIENDIFVSFGFRKVRRIDGKEISLDYVKQWQSSGTNWQINSEFDRSCVDLSAAISRNSAIVYLVLDCSSSLGDQFSTMKQYANSFIQKLFDDSYIETRVKSIRISSDNATLEKGKTMKLSAVTYPVTASDRTVKWSSSNTSVATVNDDGVVTGVSTGTTSIYATSNDGGYRGSCYLTVFDLPEQSQEQPSFSQSGLYIGVLAFNQGLYRYPICRLTADNVEMICSFIDNYPIKNGSLVYYSVDQAISYIQQPNYPADLSNAALISFSDCLDQGSLMKQAFSSNDEYLATIKQRIMSATVNSLPLAAYSIGIRGNDVSDISSYKANLEKLASSESNAYEITNINSLQAKLNDIADVVSIENEYSFSCNLTVTIPGPGNGTRIRLTFDDVSNASDSNLYIEGTFNLSNRSLTNVTYHGFSAHPGTTISGVVDGIFVTYSFNNLQKSGNTELSTHYLKEWTSDPGQSNWQINSEFDNINDVITDVSQTISKKSTVLYLVLDYSNSLGYQSSTMRWAAKEFVRNLQKESNDPFAVSSVALGRTALTLAPGKTTTLKAFVFPSTATNQSVQWFSSNSSVATVSSSGEITAIDVGNCTITAKTLDGGYTASCSVMVKDIHFEYVDLGLSVKWATFNIGASSPEEYGDYFAWGEVEPRMLYDKEYKWYDDGLGFTKYCCSRNYGVVDNKKVLEPEDDAAHVLWGAPWRMPTYSELQELRKNCSWTWTSYNGINGYEITRSGYTDSIFLPTAGQFTTSESSGYSTGIGPVLVGDLGDYWTSTLDSEYSSAASCLEFNSSRMRFDERGIRKTGFSIRPITVPVTSISIIESSTELELDRNMSYQLGVTILPSNATDKSISWSSSNTSVATVDQNGIITAKNVGKTIITALCGSVNSTRTVTVIDPVVSRFVDLGLSVKWASFNIGATKPEEYGDYFAWGEVEPKYENGDAQSSNPSWKPGQTGYNWKSYKYYLSGYDTDDIRLSKYTIWGDNKKVLEPEDDAAHVLWGAPWRMPTYSELQELENDENCSWVWIERNGVHGYKVTSKKLGYINNSIFVPAAGCRTDKSISSYTDYYYATHYWTSSRDIGATCFAINLSFTSGVKLSNYNYSQRCYGFLIRPVCE